MKKQLNPTLIGAFIVGAVVLAIATLLYYGKGQFSGEKVELVAFFRSQANGLVVGAPVVMQGVPIGSVKAIQVGYNEQDSSFYVRTALELNGATVNWPEQVQAQIELDPEGFLPKLIDSGLRARLATQSLLTGRLMVELGFFPETNVVLHGENAEIPTILTTIEQLSDSLKGIDIAEMATSIESAVKGLEKVVGGINEIVNSPKLKEIGDELQVALQNSNITLEKLNSVLEPTAENLNRSLSAVEQLAGNIKPQIASIVSSVEQVEKNYIDLAVNTDRQVTAVAGDLRGLVASAETTIQQAGKASRAASSLLAENSPIQSELLKALRNLSDAARSLKGFADYMERHPEALLKGKR